MSSKIILRIGSFLFILFTFYNCSWVGENYAQAHSSLLPLVSPSSSLEYIKLESEEFLNLYFGSESILKEQHSLQQPLEKWSHKIHSILKVKYPEELRHTPPADIVISSAVSPKDGAFVTILNRCFEYPLIFEGQAPQPILDSSSSSSASAFSFIEISEGEFRETKSLNHCVKHNEYDKNVEEVRAYLSSLLPHCQVIYEHEKGTFNIKGKCPENTLFSGKKFSGFSIAGIVNKVSFSAQILDFAFNEIKAVTLLAHELAHYYRGHLSNSIIRHHSFPFIYSTLNKSFDLQPEKSYDPSLLKLAEELKQISEESEEEEAKEAFALKDPKIKNLISLSLEKGLAEYTEEYEADVIALEILDLLGVDPQIMLMA